MKKKLLWLFLVLVTFSGGGLFIFRYFFYTPPPLEEKFVLPETEVSQISPALKGPLSGSPTPAPSVAITQPGPQAIVAGTKISYQTFNNCGPANLSMILSYYGISKSQAELADILA